jgi:hypothetical protein
VEKTIEVGGITGLLLVAPSVGRVEKITCNKGKRRIMPLAGRLPGWVIWDKQIAIGGYISIEIPRSSGHYVPIH